MNKKVRLIVGIILIVLGVISLMGLYLQTGMNLWTAFGVGLGASIFTIGLPCLGVFLIWGYKEKEKKEVKKVEMKEKKRLSNKTKKYIIISILIFLQLCLFIILVALIITCFIYSNNNVLQKDILYLIIPMPFIIIAFISLIFLEKKAMKKFA